jgi:O-antigen/teichoic acid export membrane protein
MTDALTGGEEPGAMPAARSGIAGRLGGQALYVLIGNLFTLAVGLPLQIFVSRKLGASGLGTYSLLEGAAATTAGLLGFGLAPTAVRFIPQYLDDGAFDALRQLVRQSFVLLLASGLVGYGIFLLAMSLGERSLSIHSAWPVVLLMGTIIPLSLLTFYSQQALRGFQEIRYLIMGSSFVQLTVKALAAIVLLSLGAGLVGYATATVIATLAALAWQSVGLLRQVHRLADKPVRSQERGPWRRFALISFSSSLVLLPVAYLDRFVLAFFSGAGPVGVLAVAKQLQQMPGVLYQMLLSVSAPMFASAHARNARVEQEHLYALTTDWAVKVALPLIVFLLLFAHPVLLLYGKAFADAGTLPVQILMAAQLFNLATGPCGNIAMMSGLEREAFWIDTTTTIATLLLLVVLVPFFGLAGAALSTLAGSIANNSLALLLVHARLKIRWWDRRYLRWVLPAVLTIAGAVLALRVLIPSSAFALAAILLAMYAIFGGVTLAQGLHDDDRELIALARRNLGLSP